PRSLPRPAASAPRRGVHPPSMTSAGVRSCERTSPLTGRGGGTCSRQAFHLTTSSYCYTGGADLDCTHRRGRGHEADQADADEEEHREGYAEDQGAVGVGAGRDEAGRGPERRQDGGAVSPQGV